MSAVPLPSRSRLTVLPASAVPVSVRPEVASMVGAAGGVVSTMPASMVVPAGALVLPAASAAVTVTAVPLASAVAGA